MSFTPPPIERDEEIKFVVTYDRSQGNLKKIPGFPGGNLGVPAKVAGLCGQTLISINYVATTTGLPGSSIYSDETYSMVTYPEDKQLLKLGSLIWSGTYRDAWTESGVFIANSVQEFPVTASSGIYSAVNRVIIDYNNNIRIVYLIGPKIFL